MVQFDEGEAITRVKSTKGSTNTKNGTKGRIKSHNSVRNDLIHDDHNNDDLYEAPITGNLIMRRLMSQKMD